MTVKHAYLILAHNQFELLKMLLSALDDPRNDIFIHFDKKVRNVPRLTTSSSRLVVLDDRVNVLWGDVSQIKAEYALYKRACKEGPYAYYHLISGTHFPLMSQDDIHSFFASLAGTCVMRFEPLSEDEVRMRFGLRHFFLRHLVDRRKAVNRLYHFGWRAMLAIQKKLGIGRDTSFIKGKASQWCSLTQQAVDLIVDEEKAALKRFRRSFCCDEFFVRSVIDGKVDVVDDSRICYVKFEHTTPRIFTLKDYDELKSSGAFFARKMGDCSLELCRRIMEENS